jgi:hypothetical protein
MYKCFELEKLNRKEEILELLDYMLKPERTNPFPELTFLIEDRAYHNSSSFLSDWRERLNRKETEHVIDTTSLDFFS